MIGMRGKGGAHGVCEIIVPLVHIIIQPPLWIPRGQGADQGGLDRCHRAAQRKGCLCGIIGGCNGLGATGFIVKIPGHVVIRPRSIGDAPMRHGTVRVVFQRAVETDAGLGMVVGIGPDQAPVEPELRVRRCGGDRAAEAAKVVIVVHWCLPVAATLPQEKT